MGKLRWLSPRQVEEQVKEMTEERAQRAEAQLGRSLTGKELKEMNRIAREAVETVNKMATREGR